MVVMANRSSSVVAPTRVRVPDALVEDDVAEIVHDLRNPLGAIALEMMLLDERLVGGDREAASRSVRRIQHNVDYLDRLVSDLLDVCAIASGHFKLQRTKAKLRTLLEHVVERLPAVARERVKLEAAFGPLLELDDVRIQRVVANLLDNALKYAPPASGIVVQLVTESYGACISVIDAGPGVAPADVPHLFERYRRVAGVQPRGYGIGLYVCKKIVEAHGGTIGVDTIRGEGSRFFFVLPVGPL